MPHLAEGEAEGGPGQLHHGGHLPLDQGGEHHPGPDVAGRHRTRHEPGVSRWAGGL